MLVPYWLLFVLAALTTCQITETVRHGSVFASFRAWVESRGDYWAELIGCGFCFSHWAGVIAALLVSGHLVFGSQISIDPFLFVLFWLSAVRSANLINDLTKAFSRTPVGLVPIDFDLIDDIDAENEDDHDETSTATPNTGTQGED